MIFCGIYEETKFKDQDTGYTIFYFQSNDFRKALISSLSNRDNVDYDKYTEDEKDEIVKKYKNRGHIVCKGYTTEHRVGEPLIIDGELVQDNNGSYIAINTIKKYSNNSYITKKYLMSDLFSGIGEKTANKIVEYTGADIFSFVKKEDAITLLSENIKELKGKKAEIFVNEVKNTSIQSEIFDYIYPFGGLLSNAINIYDYFGVQSLDVLKRNPYKIGYLAGLSFDTCDAIGQNIGISPYDENRIISIIFSAFNSFLNAGNTRVKFDDLLNKINVKSLMSIYKITIPAPIVAYILSTNKNFKIEKENNELYLYKTRYWDFESDAVLNLVKLMPLRRGDYITDSFVSEVEKELNIKYSKAQKECFDFLNSSGVKIITGGPGTGKTTVISGLINAYKKLHKNDKVVLCAPTGRAAQRIIDSTGMSAFTIHKLLDIKPYGNDIIYKNQNDPIDADLIIVDEISMIDIELFSILLGAIKPSATVILSGDINQLPSVGAGNVLFDLLKSEVLETHMLKTIYRQKEDSAIIENAKRIQTNNKEFVTNDDFQILRYSNEFEIKNAALELYMKLMNNHEDVQILSLQKRGISGTRELNRKIQYEINGQNDFISYGATHFAVNDKIMMIRNNYELGYYNGNIGYITEINRDNLVVNIMNEEIIIPQKLYSDIELSYAITTHKSQGSEFDNVIIVIPDAEKSSLHNRNLIYTAITRAKKRVFIISQNDSLEKCIKNKNIVKRETGLTQKIEKFLKGWNDVS